MIICVLIPPHFLFPSEDDKHLRSAPFLRTNTLKPELTHLDRELLSVCQAL